MAVAAHTWHRPALACGVSLIAHALLITGLGNQPQHLPQRRIAMSLHLRALKPAQHITAQAIPVPVAALPDEPASQAVPPEPPTPEVSITSSLPGWISNLPTQVDLNYYPAAALTSIAAPVTDIQTLLPDTALESVAAKRSTLRLLLLINEHGTVDDVEILPNSAENALEDRNLIKLTADAFRNMRFTAAMRNGLAVRSRKEIEVCLGACMPDTRESAPVPSDPAHGAPGVSSSATTPRPTAERVRRDK